MAMLDMGLGVMVAMLQLRGRGGLAESERELAGQSGGTDKTVRLRTCESQQESGLKRAGVSRRVWSRPWPTYLRVFGIGSLELRREVEAAGRIWALKFKTVIEACYATKN